KTKSQKPASRSSACRALEKRTLPSQSNGSVTNANTIAPASFAARATALLIHEPVRPPSPARTNTVSQLAHADFTALHCPSSSTFPGSERCEPCPPSKLLQISTFSISPGLVVEGESTAVNCAARNSPARSC